MKPYQLHKITYKIKRVKITKLLTKISHNNNLYFIIFFNNEVSQNIKVNIRAWKEGMVFKSY
jgi:hypothetical protein